MQDILVVHSDLTRKGGAESVCMHTIDALLPQYNLTLLTLRDPDFEELNNFYDIDLSTEDLGIIIPRIIGNLTKTMGVRGGLLRNSLLNRWTNKVAHQYDLVISTSNEMSINEKSVQYIHFPMFSRRCIPDAPGKSSIVYNLYDYLCRNIAGYDEGTISSSCLLANSNWTADIVKKAYGVRPTVVNPPVDTDFTLSGSWEERENGFVTVGRIEKSKNLVQLIETVKAIRSRGYPIHYHLVGPIDNQNYFNELNSLINNVSYISYEGVVSRGKLKKLLATHKFGLHGKKYEHFGIVVAEMVEAGMIPFVPSFGGQAEIVRNNPLLTFENSEELQSQIHSLLDSKSSQKKIKKELTGKNNFSIESFKKEMRTYVQENV